MYFNKFFLPVIKIGLVLFLTAVISSCAGKNTASPTQAVTQATVPPIGPTPIPEPTLPPEKVVIIAPDGADPLQLQAVEALVKEMAEPGMMVSVVQNLSAAEMTPDIKVVVSLLAVPNLPELIGAAPQTQFLTLSSVDLGSAPNLSVIRQQPEKLAFAAGYLSAAITPDWRISAFLPLEEPQGTIYNDAFNNGAAFYCGVCTSHAAPIVKFPVTQRISMNSDPASWQSAVEALGTYDVKMVFVAPGLDRDDFLRLIAGQNYILTGGRIPPEEIRSRWAGTISEDILTPIRSIWPGLMTGQGGQVIKTQLTLDQVNPQLVSEGRKRLIVNMFSELDNGLISPVSPPLQ